MATALTSASPEARIVQAANALPISLLKLSEYVGVSRSTFTEKLSAGKLPKDVTEHTLETLQVMQEMQEGIGLPLDWTATILVKPHVEARLRVLRESKDPTPRYIIVLKTSQTSFFMTRRGGQIVSTPSESNCAGFTSYEIAEQAARQLKKLDCDTRVERLTNTMQRKQSTLTTDIGQLGLLEL